MRKPLLAFLLLLLAGLPFSARATTLPIQGGPGGGYFEAACPEGQYLVGFSVGAGAWIDRIAVLCAPYLPSDGSFGTRAQAEFHGGSGGSPQEKYCPGNSYVHGIEFGYTRKDDDPQFVDDVEMHCWSAGAGYSETVCIDTGEGCGAVKAKPEDLPASGTIYTAFTQECPIDEAATGIHGRSGEFVDAIGLICGPGPTRKSISKAKPPVVSEQSPASKILKGAGTVVLQPPPDLPGKPSAPAGAGQPQSFPLSCLGGGAMTASASKDGFVRITFAPASRGSASAPPHAGECAWSDRGFRSGEPEMLVYGGGDKIGKDLFDAAQHGDAFQIHAYNNGQGAMVVTSIDSIEPEKNTGSPSAPSNFSFAGNWASRTNHGGAYSLTLAQNGNDVTGTYASENGRKGELTGKLHQNILFFVWSLEGGYKGAGEFELAPDGNSFSGSYRITQYQGDRPKHLRGAWEGTRK